jgi:hypothetical protein
MQNWGAYGELQPAEGNGSGLAQVLGTLMAGGGLILHGEQAFSYHQPIVTGQTLTGVTVLRDIYVKESKAATMTFVVSETTWSDEAGTPMATATFNIIHRI